MVLFFNAALDEKVNNGIVQHSTQVVIICVKIYKVPETWVVIRYSKCVYTKYMTIFKITEQGYHADMLILLWTTVQHK